MRDYPATCKQCGKAIVLKIDDSYAELGDPYQLIKLAVCNRCGDLLHERRHLDEIIRRICLNFVGSKHRIEELKERYRAPLRGFLREYQVMVAKWMNAPTPDWDDAILEAVLSAPTFYGTVLGGLWKEAKQSSAQAKLL